MEITLRIDKVMDHIEAWEWIENAKRALKWEELESITFETDLHKYAIPSVIYGFICETKRLAIKNGVNYGGLEWNG